MTAWEISWWVTKSHLSHKVLLSSQKEQVPEKTSFIFLHILHLIIGTRSITRATIVACYYHLASRTNKGSHFTEKTKKDIIAVCDIARFAVANITNRPLIFAFHVNFSWLQTLHKAEVPLWLSISFSSGEFIPQTVVQLLQQPAVDEPQSMKHSSQ